MNIQDEAIIPRLSTAGDKGSMTAYKGSISPKPKQTRIRKRVTEINISSVSKESNQFGKSEPKLFEEEDLITPKESPEREKENFH
jgi:hypothetical protein